MATDSQGNIYNINANGDKIYADGRVILNPNNNQTPINAPGQPGYNDPTYSGTAITPMPGTPAYNASTGAITPMEPPIPAVPDLSGVNGTMASTNSAIETFFQQQAEEAARKKAEAEKAQKDKPTSWKDWLTSSGNQSVNDFATDQYSDLGVNPADVFNVLKADIAEIGALNDDLNKTIAQRDKQISEIYGAGGGTNFQSNAIAQINRNANVVIKQKEGNINSKTAIMEARQGNFELAQSFVEKAVNAYTAQLQTDLEMTMSWYNDNQSLINSLGNEYSTAVTNLINTKQNELAETRRQYEWEETMKINRAQEARLGGAGTGGITGGTGFDESLTNALNDGNSPEQAAQAAFEYYSSLGYKVTYEGLLASANRLKDAMPAEEFTEEITPPKEPYVPYSQDSYNAGKTTQKAIVDALTTDAMQEKIKNIHEFGKATVDYSKKGWSFIKGLFGN